MDFAEKIRRLTAGKNKSALAEEVGLRAAAVSDIINKGHEPKSATALKLARVLNVPLDWLVDDDRDDYPPPEQPGRSLSEYDDEELMIEVATRYRREAVRLYKDLMRLDPELKETHPDWDQIAAKALSTPLNQPLPPEIERDVALARELLMLPWRINRLSPESVAELHHKQMPGGQMSPEALQSEDLMITYRRCLDNPPRGVTAILGYLDFRLAYSALKDRRDEFDYYRELLLKAIENDKPVPDQYQLTAAWDIAKKFRQDQVEPDESTRQESFAGLKTAARKASPRRGPHKTNPPQKQRNS